MDGVGVSCQLREQLQVTGGEGPYEGGTLADVEEAQGGVEGRRGGERVWSNWCLSRSSRDQRVKRWV